MPLPSFLKLLARSGLGFHKEDLRHRALRALRLGRQRTNQRGSDQGQTDSGPHANLLREGDFSGFVVGL
jgi:hypothetical protein